MTTLFIKNKQEEGKKYRKILDKIYEEGKTVFMIDDKWRRIIAPGVFIDKFSKPSKIQDETNIIDVLIGFENDSPVFAKMSKECINRIFVIYKSKDKIFSSWAYPDVYLDYTSNSFDPSRNLYIHESCTHKESLTIHSGSVNYLTPHIYNSYELIDVYKETKNNILDKNKNIDIDKSILSYLSSFTFGIEFETNSIKFMPNDILVKYGLIPLRDGSIKGFEYTTIPLSGIDGLSDLYHICEYLKKYCTYDKTCSVHIHVSSTLMPKKDVEFIERLLYVAFNIQNEIYDIMPKYKYVNDGSKNKNYTKPIPFLSSVINVEDQVEDEDGNIDSNSVSYKETSLSKFLTGVDDVKILKSGKHPKDPSMSRKWDIEQRYYWLNTIPYFFNNGTIENRMMVPTFDFNLILKWILLTSSIISYSINPKSADRPMYLSDVLKYIGNKHIEDTIGSLFK